MAIIVSDDHPFSGKKPATKEIAEWLFGVISNTSGLKVHELADKIAKDVAKDAIGVTCDSIKRAFARLKLKKGVTTDARELLCPLDSLKLASVILAFSYKNSPLTLRQVCSFAQRIANFDKQPSLGWASTYVRKMGFDVRQLQWITPSRRSAGKLEIVEAWISELQNAITAGVFPYDADFVYNVDEIKLVRVTPTSQTHYVTSTLTNGSVAGGRGINNASYVPIFAVSKDPKKPPLNYEALIVAGCPVDPVDPANSDIEAQFDCDLKYIGTRQRGIKPRIFSSPTGCMNKEKFAEIMKDFVRFRTHNGLGGRNCVVFCDNLSAHCGPEIVEELLGEGVFLIFLPENTTHAIQPLDGAPFRNLRIKVNLGAENNCWEALLVDAPEADRVIAMSRIQAAFGLKERITQKDIDAAFMERGLYPLDPDRIVKRVTGFIGNHRKRDAGAMSLYLYDYSAEVLHETAVMIAKKIAAAQPTYLGGSGQKNVLMKQDPDTKQYFPYGVVDHHRAKQEELKKREAQRTKQENQRKRKREIKEAEADAKAVLRELRTCKGQHCDRFNRTAGADGWHACKCEAYVICRTCWSIEKVRADFDAHASACRIKKLRTTRTSNRC